LTFICQLSKCEAELLLEIPFVRPQLLDQFIAMTVALTRDIARCVVSCHATGIVEVDYPRRALFLACQAATAQSCPHRVGRDAEDGGGIDDGHDTMSCHAIRRVACRVGRFIHAAMIARIEDGGK
jgi:hypothetical protein